MEETQIFFKGNPVTSNNYIPKSALYNRKTKNYIVEMPEGENYFPAPRKRQFSQLHYQSQIRETGLFQNKNNTKLMKHSNLQTKDIEGATANSLLAEAVKNRLKVKYLSPKRQDRNIHHQRFKTEVQIAQNPQTPRNNEKQLNYHLRNRIKTQVQTPHESHDDRFDHQLYLKQDRMKKLQNQLFQRQRKSMIQRQYEYQHRLSEQKPIQQRRNIEIAKQERPVHDKIKTQGIEQQQRQLNKDKTLIMRKNKKVSELQNIWHGDSRKIRIIPKQEIRKWNPTFFPQNNPYHLPKIN